MLNDNRLLLQVRGRKIQVLTTISGKCLEELLTHLGSVHTMYLGSSPYLVRKGCEVTCTSTDNLSLPHIRHLVSTVISLISDTDI